MEWVPVSWGKALERNSLRWGQPRGGGGWSASPYFCLGALRRNEASDREEACAWWGELPGPGRLAWPRSSGSLPSPARPGPRVPRAPTAASSLLSRLPPPPPRPARPPARNRKGKEVISTVSGSPEKLPSSEGAAGFLELETNQSHRERRAPPAAALCVCHFPDSAEHVSCGCHAAGHLGAVGSSWLRPRLRSAQGWQAGGGGAGSGGSGHRFSSCPPRHPGLANGLSHGTSRLRESCSEHP